MTLLLASASPRRRALLAVLGIPFEVAEAGVDESAAPGEAPAALARRLARAKAAAVARRRSGDVAIGADTIVVLDGEILGKPADPDEAARTLRRLRGREHEVMSVVALAVSAGAVAALLVASRVRMRVLEDDEIRRYVASGDPLDKAGSYAIQNEQFRPVAAHVGCYCNIVGLPLGATAALLDAAGLPPPVPAARACPYGLYDATACEAGTGD